MSSVVLLVRGVLGDIANTRKSPQSAFILRVGVRHLETQYTICFDCDGSDPR